MSKKSHNNIDEKLNTPAEYFDAIAKFDDMTIYLVGFKRTVHLSTVNSCNTIQKN
jgi:hypothetical protein